MHQRMLRRMKRYRNKRRDVEIVCISSVSHVSSTSYVKGSRGVCFYTPTGLNSDSSDLLPVRLRAAG